VNSCARSHLIPHLDRIFGLHGFVPVLQFDVHFSAHLCASNLSVETFGHHALRFARAASANTSFDLAVVQQ